MVVQLAVVESRRPADHVLDHGLAGERDGETHHGRIARWKSTWRGALLIHSSPRSTCVIPISSSSSVAARWYVGKPSDLSSTWSSSLLLSKVDGPRITSSITVLPVSGMAKRTTAGSPGGRARGAGRC